MTDHPDMRLMRDPDKSGFSEMSAREFTRYLFQWLTQVVIDPDLPASAFKVAFVIGQHTNRKDGKAYPGTRTIAKAAALAQSNVIKMVPKLVANGHIALEPGRAGSGHSHRYHLVLKDHPVDHLGPPEKITPLINRMNRKDHKCGENDHPVDRNDHPVDQNYLLNNLKEEPVPLRYAQRALRAADLVDEESKKEPEIDIDQWLTTTTREERAAEVLPYAKRIRLTQEQTAALTAEFVTHYRSTNEVRASVVWPVLCREWLRARSRKRDPTP